MLVDEQHGGFDVPARLSAMMEMTADAEVYSLDSDFDRIPGVTRIEP